MYNLLLLSLSLYFFSAVAFNISMIECPRGSYNPGTIDITRVGMCKYCPRGVYGDRVGKFLTFVSTLNSPTKFYQA